MKNLEQYEINTIQSGTDDGCHWVSLHFDSPNREYDRIHIVCDSEMEKDEVDLTGEDLYLERDDQLYGGSGLALAVTASGSFIEFTFTDEGQKTLEFSERLRLSWNSAIDGWTDAFNKLKEMQKHFKVIIIEE